MLKELGDKMYYSIEENWGYDPKVCSKNRVIIRDCTQEEMIEIRTLLYRLCDVPEKGRNKI